MRPQLLLSLFYGVVLSGFSSAVAGRLPPDLTPNVAYFDAGDLRSLVVDRYFLRVSEQRDLLATPTNPRPTLKWQGNCRYENGSRAAGGAIVMDGWSCWAKLSGPLCGANTTCLNRAYTVVLVAQLLRFGMGETIVSALAASQPPKRRIAWKTSGVLVRTVPAGGFAPGYLDDSDPDYNNSLSQNTKQVFTAPEDGSSAWKVHTLVGTPAPGSRGKASLYRGPPHGKPLFSGSAPGILAPNGTDFVIGCDYLEYKQDSGENATVEYRCHTDDDNYYLQGRLGALLVYDRALSSAEVSRLVAHYIPRLLTTAPSPPPPILQRPPPARGPLPANLMPDVAFFDAGDRGSLAVDSSTGRVITQRDIMATPQLDRPALVWSGDCRYDSAAGGSVVLDGRTCFAKLEPGRLCDWDRTPGGYTMVLVAQFGSTQQKNVAILSALDTYPADLWSGRRRFAWRPNQVLSRSVTYKGFTAPENNDPDDKYDDKNLPDATAKTSFVYPKASAATWTLEALVGRPNAGNGNATYYRGGPKDTKSARRVYNGRAPSLVAPSGKDFVLGCDFMEFAPAQRDGSWRGVLEYRCDINSHLQGRVAAVLVYSRLLSAADVSRLLAYYRTTRWLAPGVPPSPPPLRPSPPSPPGTGLPAELLPDLAYFDAAAVTANRLVLPRPGGPASSIGALLDVLHPEQQRLDWTGDCRYDTSAGGGAVVLDGSSCYAKMTTDLCGKWQLMLNSNGNPIFSLVVVLELDGKNPAPPPKPPLAPAWNIDHEIGELDTSGLGIMSYGMQDSGYYYFGVPSMQWTTKSTYMTKDGGEDYNNVDYRKNLPKPVPRGVWTLEAITTAANATDKKRRTVYSRGTLDVSKLVEVFTEDYTFPAPDGTEFRVGCTWRDTELFNECKPGSFLRGRLSAVLVYSRALSQNEVQALHTYFRQRWTASRG